MNITPLEPTKPITEAKEKHELDGIEEDTKIVCPLLDPSKGRIIDTYV